MSEAAMQEQVWPLSQDEYQRYGRQMIMPEWGLPGQLRLKAAKVAVVGEGGLGCPALQYLVGAGVGSITIIDHDVVSVSNLHRQILHTTDRVDMNKALSACIALREINPHPNLFPVTEPLTQASALELLREHDLVLDCTDRPLTRYLINDACVRLGMPLVSGAALGAAGQWAVYGGCFTVEGHDIRRACYRCLWPKPGPSARCDEAGVWGPVTGIVGNGMAAEALKVIIGNATKPTLHILHMGGSPMIRTVGMRPPASNCFACGPNAIVTDDLTAVNYVTFCAANTPSIAETTDKRLTVQELHEVMQLQPPDVAIVDTRPPVEYEICALPDTINIPLEVILRDPEAVPDVPHLIFLCRRGNDSQLAAAHLRIIRPESSATDVCGGLVSWSSDVDPNFPVY